MTYRVDVTEASSQLLDLILAVEKGEEVIITKNAQPAFQLVLIQNASAPRPRFGSARGRVHIRDDFDVPLDEFQAYLP